MPNKQSIIISLLVMVTGIAMLLGTNVMALTLPEQCTGGKFTLAYQEGPVTLNEATTDPIFGQITCPSYPCYYWHYTVEGKDKDLQSLTAVTIYYESHPDNPISYVSGASSTEDYLCNESRANDWGEGICNGVVIQFNSQQMVQGPGYRDLYFIVDKNTWGTGSAAFHSGNTGGKVDNCLAEDSNIIVGGIKAPGYNASIYDIATVNTTYEYMSGEQVRILRTKTTGCGYGVQRKSGTQWVDVDPTTDVPTINGHTIEDAGDTLGSLGRKCKEFRLTTSGSVYQWIYIAGNWYKILVSP